MLSSHDRMRESVKRYGFTQAEIVDIIFKSLGGQRGRIESQVDEFLSGGKLSVAVAVAIVQLISDDQNRTLH